MKSLPRLGVHVLLALFLFAGSVAVGTPAAAAGKRYVCPPCGTACDTIEFAAPGVCPTCGMTLIEASTAAAKPVARTDQKKVAILVFNGAEILDFSGPYEMFGAAGCDVYTVAATKDPITTAMGLTVIPQYSFANAPQPDVLVIPGGGVYAASRDKATLRYVKDVTARATNTMSVCNGAFILANAGLLDGLTATTTYGNIPKLRSQYPKIHVVDDKRYVDNGKIITTAGLSAGIDGALHVIGRMFGNGYAQRVALGEEYDWKPGGGFARAALADHQIPAIQLDNVGAWNLIRTEGDTNRWDIVVGGQSDLATPDLMNRIEQVLAKSKWVKVGSAGSNPASRTSTWRFTGTDGKPWKGTLKLEGIVGSGHERTAALSVARVG